MKDSTIQHAGRKVVQALTLDLPRPISVNALWTPVSKRGRATQIRSAAYRAWIIDAGNLINVQRPGRMADSYGMHIAVSHGWNGDLDNAVKACGDILQEHGIVSNDRCMTELHVTRAAVEGIRVQLFAPTAREAA